MTTQIDLERMTDDQLCRWVCARRGVYSAQEREAIHAFLDSMPHHPAKLAQGETVNDDIKFGNLLDEARVAYESGNYIRAWTLVGTAQTVIARRQETEDRTNGRAAANRVD